MTEAQIQKHMDILKCTREEAIEVIKYDELIDKGKDPLPLTKEQEKISKEMRRVDSGKPRKSNGIPTVRTKKVDANRNDLINAILASINPIATDVTTVHDGREYTCIVGGTKYKIAISAPRS